MLGDSRTVVPAEALAVLGEPRCPPQRVPAGRALAPECVHALRRRLEQPAVHRFPRDAFYRERDAPLAVGPPQVVVFAANPEQVCTHRDRRRHDVRRYRRTGGPRQLVCRAPRQRLEHRLFALLIQQFQEQRGDCNARGRRIRACAVMVRHRVIE